jgi:hypothetical protein
MPNNTWEEDVQKDAAILPNTQNWRQDVGATGGGKQEWWGEGPQLDLDTMLTKCRISRS